LPPVHLCIGVSTWVISEHQEARDCARDDGMTGDGCRSSRHGILPHLYEEEDYTDYRERWQWCDELCSQQCGRDRFTRLVLPSWHAGH
jgi:hypothetical protein